MRWARTVDMRVRMHLPVSMAMHMDMHPGAKDAPEDVCPEYHEHETNAQLEPLLQTGWNCRPQRENDTSDACKRQRVPDAPRDSLANRRTQRTLARRQCRDRGQMVRLQRVFHAYEEADHQNAQHAHAA